MPELCEKINLKLLNFKPKQNNEEEDYKWKIPLYCSKVKQEPLKASKGVNC